MEKKITSEFLVRYANSHTTTLDVLHGSLTAKITLAYNFLCDLLETEREVLREGVHVTELLSHNIHTEAFKTLIASDLVSLIGTGKNDKNSIYTEAIKTESGKVFYEENKAELANLKAIRNTIYSHSDLDYEDKTKTLSMNFVKRAIEFITKFLRIENPPIRPKDSDKYFYLGYKDFLNEI